MTHPQISRMFMKRIGVDADYAPGDIIVIRGKKYRFPSFTHVFDASRGNLSEYQVKEDG